MNDVESNSCQALGAGCGLQAQQGWWADRVWVGPCSLAHIARHVIDTRFEPSLLEVNGFL
jgi:hypothetical protein